LRLEQESYFEDFYSSRVVSERSPQLRLGQKKFPLERERERERERESRLIYVNQLTFGDCTSKFICTWVGIVIRLDFTIETNINLLHVQTYPSKRDFNLETYLDLSISLYQTG